MRCSPGTLGGRAQFPSTARSRSPGSPWPARPSDHRDLGFRAWQRRRHPADPARHRPALARLRDRRGMFRVLAAGVAAFGFAYAGFAATAASIPLLAAAFALAGIGIGCVETAEHAAVATLAPEHVRGSAFGVLAAVQSLGNLVASTAAGLIYTLASPAAAFTVAAALMVAALIVLTASRSASPWPRELRGDHTAACAFHMEVVSA